MIPQTITISLAFHSWMIPAALTLTLLIAYIFVIRDDKKVEPTNSSLLGLFDMIDGVAGLLLGLMIVLADLLVWLIYFAVMYFTK